MTHIPAVGLRLPCPVLGPCPVLQPCRGVCHGHAVETAVFGAVVNEVQHALNLAAHCPVLGIVFRNEVPETSPHMQTRRQ
jgi:hypothetical protein